MFISLPLGGVNAQHICFDAKKDNTIMSNSDFYMIHYRNPFCGMHNFVVTADVGELRAERAFHKYAFQFGAAGAEVGRRLALLEEAVLRHFAQSLFAARAPGADEERLLRMAPRPTIAAGVAGGAFRTKHVTGAGAARLGRLADGETTTARGARVHLKVSGVWASADEYGLIYKMVVEVGD